MPNVTSCINVLFCVNNREETIWGGFVKAGFGKALVLVFGTVVPFSVPSVRFFGTVVPFSYPRSGFGGPGNIRQNHSFRGPKDDAFGKPSLLSPAKKEGL